MSAPKRFQLNQGHIFGGRFYWGSMKKKSIKAKWCFIKPGFVAKLTCFQVLFRNSVKHEQQFCETWKVYSNKWRLVMFCQIPTITNSSSQLDSAFVKKLLQFLDFPFLVFVFVFWQRSTITESTNSAGLVFWGKKMHPGCYCYLSIQMGIRFLERFPFMI